MKSRWIGALVFASLWPASPASTAPTPKRVVSLNLCTDELLLALADPRQIASVSHLAQLSHETPDWRMARRYPANDGSIISVIDKRPDLILAMGGGGRDAGTLARRIGARLLTLPYTDSLARMKASVRSVGAALGRPQAAERLLAPVEALERTRPSTAVDTIWLDGGGRTLPASGIGAEWMRLAGLKQRTLTGDRVSLEQLLVDPPRLILKNQYRADQYSAEQRWLSHPLAAKVGAARMIRTDGRRWTCMGPALAPEMARIRREAGK